MQEYFEESFLLTLLLLFEYDLWANRQWLGLLQRRGMPEPDASVFQHILSAQEIWWQRCQGDSPRQMPTPALTDGTLVALHGAWCELLSTRADDSMIDYHRTTGEPHSLYFHQIAQHVCNHGTYHRGELRGLRRAAGDSDFPDTDLSGWLFEAGLNP